MNCEILCQDATDLLVKLIETPRTSRNEAQAADMLEDVMRNKYGMDVQRDGNNLWCIAGDYTEGRQTLLLNAHIDTVKPCDSWTRDPYTATIEDDRIYGLGSNDDGASLVTLLQVFRFLSVKERAYNLIFLASCEEEVSGKAGIEHALTKLPHIDAALVGEPTGMQPAIAEKGLMVLDFTAHGRSGHAARDEGDNAIYHALDDINWLRNCSFPKVSPMLGPVKMSVTIVNAGTQHNVVPDTCMFTADIRSNELYTNTEILEYIESNVKSDVKARSTRLMSSMIYESHPMVQRAIQMGLKPFGSPTLSDQALLRCPSMKMGPGQSCRSHTADEFVCFSEIRHALDTYIQLLDGLAL